MAALRLARAQSRLIVALSLWSGCLVIALLRFDAFPTRRSHHRIEVRGQVLATAFHRICAREIDRLCLDLLRAAVQTQR